MARKIICDICKNETTELVGKVFFTPLGHGRGRNNFANNYTHHADVGVCCAKRLLSGFNFSPRKSAKEYAETRRKAPLK